MKELAWIFGHSSNFSQALISEFRDNDISTYGWGRDTLDYTDFNKFIEGKVVPDIVILNANIEEQIALQINTQNYKDISVDDMTTMLTKYSPVFLFFIKLIKWLESKDEPVKICSITSSITGWPFKDNQYVMYAVLRSMLQQVVFSASNSVTTAFCVSPSGIDANNIKDYAKDVVYLLDKRTDLALIDLGLDRTVIDLLKNKDE